MLGRQRNLEYLELCVDKQRRSVNLQTKSGPAPTVHLFSGLDAPVPKFTLLCTLLTTACRCCKLFKQAIPAYDNLDAERTKDHKLICQGIALLPSTGKIGKRQAWRQHPSGFLDAASIRQGLKYLYRSDML